MNQREAFDAWWGKHNYGPFANIAWDAWQAAQAAQPVPQCTRSHPHELMDGYCELRTEIARLTNENARLKAAQPVEPDFKYMQGKIERLQEMVAADREAMRSAMEALVKLSEESDCNIDPFTFWRWGGDAAIAQLRAALGERK